MKKFLKRYYVIFILIILFAAPGFSAWYFFNHPELLGNTSTNKGKLLTPLVRLKALEPSTKWHLIFFTKNACEVQCTQQLEKIAKIRLALGRKLYEVDLNLVIPTDRNVIPKTLLASINALGYRITKSGQSLEKIPPVLIANPDGYLVLGFNKDTNPADIFHDLKHLISNPNAVNTQEKQGVKH
jgi:hypothetical protein